MKIKRISVDGYGKFSGKNLEFAPGLQVILGPNEQGKSTVRSFIGDMLYGQKKSTHQRVYDEANALRVPWHNPDCYGGSLVYELSDGTEIEVTRNFDRKRESIQVYDRTNARDITGEFDLLRNRELNFAQSHIGLTKDVFLNTATISHFSLEDLGDKDALNQIREKLLSLADSGEDSGSADQTLQRLKQRLVQIGQKNARTKPLPMLRIRKHELFEEQKRADEVQSAIEALSEQRHDLLEELKNLRQERLAIEESLHSIDAYELQERLRNAESLVNRIDSATEHCFALGSVREFPLDKESTVNAANENVTQAEGEHTRLLEELQDVQQQVEQEQRQLEQEGVQYAKELSEEMETTYLDLHSNATKLEERLTETRDLVEQAQQRLAETQEKEADLPDYSQVAADPVEYIRQLASSFSVAQKSRDEELREFEIARADVDDRRRAIAENHQLFKDIEDFPDLARQYELNKRVFEEELNKQRGSLQEQRVAKEDLKDGLPGFTLLTGALGIALPILGGAYVYRPVQGILIAGGIMLLAFLYFGYMVLRSRSKIKSMSQDIESLESQLEEKGANDSDAPGKIDALLEQSGCETLRELEARYDAYREASAELSIRIFNMQQLETKAEESQERVSQMVTRFQDTFDAVGETIEREDDVEDAARRAISRYQEYRETKRYVTECRNVLERHEAEAIRLGDELRESTAQCATLEQDIRRILRDSGFEDERRHEETESAIRAYRKRLARHREARGRVELLMERTQLLESKISTTEETLQTHQKTLANLLDQADVPSIEQWNTTLAQAKEYQEVWQKRGTLEEQLRALLQDDDLEELRATCAEQGDAPILPDKTKEQLKAEHAQISRIIDEKLKEEHTLHIAMTERGAGGRSTTEIEEELAQVEGRESLLDQEMEATTYAMALIEDIARDKHARIAPKLAEIASQHMEKITGGAYSELLINRDMNISVRIPETNILNENPERTLSKGTVDQVYLALRLSLLQSISDLGEPAPMLLDDPFANYDDKRLTLTMALLQDIAQQYQVILFTCREDVGTAAEAINAPIIRL